MMTTTMTMIMNLRNALSISNCNRKSPVHFLEISIFWYRYFLCAKTILALKQRGSHKFRGPAFWKIFFSGSGHFLCITVHRHCTIWDHGMMSMQYSQLPHPTFVNRHWLYSHCKCCTRIKKQAVGGRPPRYAAAQASKWWHDIRHVRIWIGHQSPLLYFHVWPASRTNQSGLVTLTFWPWKCCPSHVWRELPLCQFWSS